MQCQEDSDRSALDFAPRVWKVGCLVPPSLNVPPQKVEGLFHNVGRHWSHMRGHIQSI